MSTWAIERLDRQHDRTQFDCGVAALNDWLQKLASQHERRDLARTYVALAPGDQRVLGYYAISNHRVTYAALPPDQARGLPRVDVPVVLLADWPLTAPLKDKGWVNTCSSTRYDAPITLPNRSEFAR